MRIGYASAWDRVPESTWSYTPWNLRAAMRKRQAREGFEVTDLGFTFPRAVSAPLRALYTRRVDGRMVSGWMYSAPARRYGRTMLRRAARRAACDVALEVSYSAVLDTTPYVMLQDLSFDVLIDELKTESGLVYFPTLGHQQVQRLRDIQRQDYAAAAGVVAMSQWFADHLVEVSGVPREKVHVVHPGASAALTGPDVITPPAETRKKLLFVGKDFFTKSGPEVLQALEILRRDVDPAISLTVVGPKTWPMPGEVPEGVTFLGRRPVAELPEIYASHDVFVMPSRFEGFGIALAEASVHGLPCVARDAYAMPEIVRPGENGQLVANLDPHEIADAIAKVLADDAMALRVAAQGPEAAAYWSWDRAAGGVLDALRATVG